MLLLLSGFPTFVSRIVNGELESYCLVSMPKPLWPLEGFVRHMYPKVWPPQNPYENKQRQQVSSFRKVFLYK